MKFVIRSAYMLWNQQLKLGQDHCFFRCDNFCDKNRRLKFADVLLHEVTVTTALWLVTVDQLFFVSSSLTVTLISVYNLECDLIVFRFGLNLIRLTLKAHFSLQSAMNE